MVIRENRRAYLINFSRGIKTLDLHDVVTPSTRSPGSSACRSTAAPTSPTLYEVIRQLRGNDYQDADVLIISDFIMYTMDADVLRDVRFSSRTRTPSFTASPSVRRRTRSARVLRHQLVYDPKQKGIIGELTKG